MAKPPRPLRERIEAAISVDANGCWIWQGPRTPYGYGIFHTGSRVDGTKRQGGAHRAAYEMFVGPIPEGLELDHLCRVRACVNPDHLEPVTHLENMRRAPASQKTHCLRGHEYTPENTRLHRGKRACRTCIVESEKRRQARRRAERERAA
jgi:hypothetical protein